MFDLQLFRNGTFVGANSVASSSPRDVRRLLLHLALHAADPGLLAGACGATFLPMTILIILIAPIAGRASDRLGSRWLMAGGMSLVGVSLLLFARLEAHTSFWGILPGLVVGGTGMALAMTPMTAAAMSAVPVDKAGVGSGDAQHVPAGRRLVRDRDHGRDPHQPLVERAAGRRDAGRRVHLRAARGALRRGSDRVRGGGRRRHRDPQPRRAPHRACGGRGERMKPAHERGVTARGRQRHAARLSASERRQAIVDAALRVFSEGSYAGATTAQIAREAGISEPILYRHFALQEGAVLRLSRRGLERAARLPAGEDGRGRSGRGVA